MFGISFPELLFIMFVILLLFGPDKLPEMAAKFGRFMGELNRSTRGVRREFYNAVYAPADEIQKSIKRELTAVKSEVTAIKSEVTATEPSATRNEAAEKPSSNSDTPKVEGEK